MIKKSIPKALLKTVIEDIENQQIKFGKYSIEFVFHDGKVCKYVAHTDIAKNTMFLYQQENNND